MRIIGSDRDKNRYVLALAKIRTMRSKDLKICGEYKGLLTTTTVKKRLF